MSRFKKQKEKQRKHYFLTVARWLLINLHAAKDANGTVSIQEMLHLVGAKAFFFVILLFTFPVALPLPYPPGFPSICAIPIFLLSVQMAVNRKEVILPAFVKNYRISMALISVIIRKSESIFRFISKIVKPSRMGILTSDALLIPYGLLFIALSSCILIPFPGTNFIPAVGIFVICIGLLFKDGLLAIIGSIIGISGIFIVYFFSAIFAAMLAKFVKFTYNKLIGQDTLLISIGIIIGAAGMLLVYSVAKVLIFKVKKFGEHKKSN